MPSLLTRHVFRCLISNEHILHPGCLRRQAPGALSRWRLARPKQHNLRACPLPVAHHQQRRTLFSFPSFSKSSRDDRGISYDPGIDVMMDLVKRKRMQARLPDVEIVCAAINEYWKAMEVTPTKTREPRQVPDTHAALLLESYRYCIDGGARLPWEADDTDPGTRPVLDSGCKVLARLKTGVTTSHLELARLLYDLRLHRSTDVVGSLELHSIVNVLCCLDRPTEAFDILKQIDIPAAVKPAVLKQHENAWSRLLRAYKKQDDESGMLAAFKAGKQLELDQSAKAILLMIELYANRQDISKLQNWFTKLRLESDTPVVSRRGGGFATTLRAALKCCLQANRLDLGHAFVRQVMLENPGKPLWDEILVWGFMQQKSVDEVNRMMDVMTASNRDIKDKAEWRLPNTSTINRLVETAIEAKDPYIAERLISTGKDRGIEPNWHTLSLQMQYRLDVNDIDGALLAYKHLQSQDLSSNEDVPVVNRLIVALASSNRHDHETIMNVAADLSDRRATFEPATVQALTVVHLKRDELEDMQDLIKTHAHDFSSADRGKLQRVIREFCVSKTTPTASMWDVYNILRQDFDEMTRGARTEIMTNCFARRRPDMAVHVFSHMRVHSREDTMPTADTYVVGFLGAGQIKNHQSLRALHNQLKLDTNVDHTTRVRNALMIAYTACDQGEEALSIWDDIVDSREGPTYNSILIALRACEVTDFADAKAQEIWARLRRNNVDLDQNLWASYIAALAGNGDISTAVTTLEEAYRKDEVELDNLVLGSLYNAAVLTGRHKAIASWAEAEHKDAWERLQEVKMVSERGNAKSFQLNRSLEP